MAAIVVATVPSMDKCLHRCCTVCFVVLGRYYRSLITESSSIYREYFEEIGLEFAGYLCYSCAGRINRLQKLDHDIKTSVDRLKAARKIVINELKQLVNTRHQCAPVLPFVPDRGKQKVRKKSIQVDERKVADFKTCKKGLKSILPAPSPVIIINDGRNKPKPEESNPNGRVADDKKRKIENGVNVIPVKQVKTTPDAVAAEPASSEEPPPNKPVLLVRNYNTVTKNNLSLLLPKETIQSDVGLAGMPTAAVTSAGYTGIIQPQGQNKTLSLLLTKGTIQADVGLAGMPTVEVTSSGHTGRSQPQGQENKTNESVPSRNGKSIDNNVGIVISLMNHEMGGQNKDAAEGNIRSSNDFSSTANTSGNDLATPSKFNERTEVYKLTMANPIDGSQDIVIARRVKLDTVEKDGQYEQTYSQYRHTEFNKREESSLEIPSSIATVNQYCSLANASESNMTAGTPEPLHNYLTSGSLSDLCKNNLCSISSDSSEVSVHLASSSTSVININHESGSSLNQDIDQDDITYRVSIKQEKDDEEYNTDSNPSQCEKSLSCLQWSDHSDEVSVKQEQSEEYNSQFNNSQFSPPVLASDSLQNVKSASVIPTTDDSNVINMIKQEHYGKFSSLESKVKHEIAEQKNSMKQTSVCTGNTDLHESGTDVTIKQE